MAIQTGGWRPATGGAEGVARTLARMLAILRRYAGLYGGRLLVERVKAVLRSFSPKDATPAASETAHLLDRGKLRLDPERHTCRWDNHPVMLTVTEFLLLQALATRPGVIKTRDALMDAAYDEQAYVDDRTIDSHIKRLRKKFKRADDNFDAIETLYGVGYRWRE